MDIFNLDVDLVYSYLVKQVGQIKAHIFLPDPQLS